jgi:hypothetical protein
LLKLTNVNLKPFLCCYSEGEFETYYYSTPSQLDELLHYLGRDGGESRLVADIKCWYDEIVLQMGITKELTDNFKGESGTTSN